MSIAIDGELCRGCGRCREVCPGGLIELAPRAYLSRPEECWGCAACVKVCGAGAPALYLPPEAGGSGALLKAAATAAGLAWTAVFPDGSERRLAPGRPDTDY